jgi:hypothetical protein
MKYLAFTILTLSFLSCKNTSEINTELTSNSKKLNSKTTSCLLIQKSFTNKGGYTTEHKEYYLRCSIQDYFIKICESNVTSEELKPFLNNGIEVEMEIQEGFLDNCNTSLEQTQSRAGTYAIIKKIIK